MLELCVLGSGSKGNAIYISDGDTRLLIDAGLSARQIDLRLRESGVPLDSIGAILVSHGIRTLMRGRGMSCFANRLTAESMVNGARFENLTVFSTGETFSIGAFSIHPFSVPHDAVDPVGFEITNGGRKICVATDLGHATNLVREVMKGSHYIVLEANHDENMLLGDIRRPWALKQRIRGKAGHLSNRDAGRLIADVAGGNLKRVFLAHLSQDCNTESMAMDTVCELLKTNGISDVEISMTYQERPTNIATLA